MDTPFTSLAQIFLSPLFHDPTTPLSVSSHLPSFQRYRSTCRIFEKPISWSLYQILLLSPSYSKFSILLLLSSLLLSFPFLIFSSFLCSFSSYFLPSFSLFSSFFCFCHSSFSCFGFYCFLYSFGHLVIFTSPVL